MQLFIVVLTDHEFVNPILKKLNENDYHGSVLATKSIHHALMDSVEPLPYFGGLNKVVESDEELSRPMLFVVVKDDSDVEKLSSLVKEITGPIKGKGFMYSIPINHVEGLDQ